MYNSLIDPGRSSTCVDEYVHFRLCDLDSMFPTWHKFSTAVHLLTQGLGNWSTSPTSGRPWLQFAESIYLKWMTNDDMFIFIQVFLYCPFHYSSLDQIIQYRDVWSPKNYLTVYYICTFNNPHSGPLWIWGCFILSVSRKQIHSVFVYLSVRWKYSSTPTVTWAEWDSTRFTNFFKDESMEKAMQDGERLSPVNGIKCSAE